MITDATARIQKKSIRGRIQVFQDPIYNFIIEAILDGVPSINRFPVIVNLALLVCSL